MVGTKLTRQKEGRMESCMVGTEITRQMDGWHKNNSPKGWVEGKFIGRHRYLARPRGSGRGKLKYSARK